jgi:hypoxanthine-guanine phosphoribosyltransferase
MNPVPYKSILSDQEVGGTGMLKPNRHRIDDAMTVEAVLLVAADVLSGGTMKFFVKQIEAVQPAALKTGCLVKGITATLCPDYIGREIPADFVMPWMYKGYGYVRDSRKPAEKGQEKTA